MLNLPIFGYSIKSSVVRGNIPPIAEANPRLVLNIPIFGNLVGFDLDSNHNQMGQSRRRKNRNLNGLHEEAVIPSHGSLDRLPPPTTPLHDMRVLVGECTVASLLGSSIERIEFL